MNPSISSENPHIPVLLAEVVAALDISPGECHVDGECVTVSFTVPS